LSLIPPQVQNFDLVSTNPLLVVFTSRWLKKAKTWEWTYILLVVHVSEADQKLMAESCKNIWIECFIYSYIPINRSMSY
jgi:hypothetical protein